MTLHFYHTPFLFHEATELLFHYTNGLPMPDLSQKKSPYSIPAGELERMISEACQDIPWENEALQFFFRQYKLPQSTDGAFTCIARVLTFSFADLSSKTAEQAVGSIITRLQKLRESGASFESLRTFTIDTYAGSEANAGILSLDAPSAFRKAFLAVYSDPVGTLSPLVPLIQPVMEYLQQALRPWAFRAEPMMKVWEDTLRSQTPEKVFKEALNYGEVPPVEHMELGIVYFLPQWVLLGLENDASTMKLFIGAGSYLFMDNPTNGLMGWEYRAFHLLSSPDRVRMLNAIHQKPMSSRELAQELNLHLGTVTRDINSMDEAHLLNAIQDGSRRRYGLNCQALQTLAHHLLAMCQDPNVRDDT